MGGEGRITFGNIAASPKYPKLKARRTAKTKAKRINALLLRVRLIRIIVKHTSLEVICLPTCVEGESAKNTEGNEETRKEEDHVPNVPFTTLATPRNVHHSILVCYQPV